MNCIKATTKNTKGTSRQKTATPPFPISSLYAVPLLTMIVALSTFIANCSRQNVDRLGQYGKIPMPTYTPKQYTFEHPNRKSRSESQSIKSSSSSSCRPWAHRRHLLRRGPSSCFHHRRCAQRTAHGPASRCPDPRSYSA